MRKYDRNAAFNIFVKGLLFISAAAVCFAVASLLSGANILLSLILSALTGAAVILLFSFLLRYTRFYYGYYGFVSKFLFRSVDGKVFCPCCGKHFAGFRDLRFYADTERFNPAMFSRNRQDVICDFCRSAPRHRMIAEWAEDNAGTLRGSEILYFAPELSMMLWFRRHGIGVRTADLYDRRTDLKLDITSIDLPDDSVDIVFCNHVIEHVSDYSLALSELRRILRTGGKLIISFPIDPDLEGVLEEQTGSPAERIRLCGQCDHLRVFGKDSGRILEEAGFTVGTIDAGSMPGEIVAVPGPADYDTDTVFCCIKK